MPRQTLAGAIEKINEDSAQRKKPKC